MPLFKFNRTKLTLSSQQANTDIFANSADLDEMASTLFAILLLHFDWNPCLQQWMCPNSELEESMSETWGWKG